MKQLKFIHITKTAGTTLENEARAHGILWGIFHEEYGFHHDTFPKKSDELKKKYDWFTVVRNPYTRIISEFHCQWGNPQIVNGKRVESFTKEEFNEFLIHKINCPNKQALLGNHYNPQYWYIDEKVPITVLKFENLKPEFDELMKKYNLPVTINSHKNKTQKVFNICDFNSKLHNLINKVYDKDFEMFGYEMLNT